MPIRFFLPMPSHAALLIPLLQARILNTEDDR